MNLTRMGANRKEVRTTAFADREPRISIDPESGSVKLLVKCADGMETQGQYDYTVTIAPRDLTAILNAISVEHTAFRPGELQTCLGASAAVLLRLLSAASALPYQLAPTEAQLKFQTLKGKLATRRANDT